MFPITAVWPLADLKKIGPNRLAFEMLLLYNTFTQRGCNLVSFKTKEEDNNILSIGYRL